MTIYPPKRPKLNWLQRKFTKHPKIESAFDTVGIIWLTITSAVVAFAAGLLATTPGVPIWSPLILGAVYAPYLSYKS